MLDQHLKCLNCHKTFTYTEGERQFFASRGLSTPRRCKACRALARGGAVTAPKPLPKAAPKPQGGHRPEVCRFCGTPDGVVFETTDKNTIPHGVTYWAKDRDNRAPWSFRIKILSAGGDRWRCQYCQKIW